MVERRLGVQRVVDLSATPFFLSGSGYAEGTCSLGRFATFPLWMLWNVELSNSRVRFLTIWGAITNFQCTTSYGATLKADAKKSSQGNKELDPLAIPAELQTALSTLYGHYEKTYNLWQNMKSVFPLLHHRLNNTATSKLVYDYVSGFFRELEDGTSVLQHGRLELFRNFDDENPIPRPRTLLIDSTR